MVDRSRIWLSCLYLSVVLLGRTFYIVDRSRIWLSCLFLSVVLLGRTFYIVDRSRIWLSCLYLSVVLLVFGYLRLYLSVVLLGRTLYIIWLSGLLTLSILFEGYSRNESCTLNYVFMFLFLERCLFKIILL
jgi:hypothetical protein